MSPTWSVISTSWMQPRNGRLARGLPRLQAELLRDSQLHVSHKGFARGAASQSSFVMLRDSIAYSPWEPAALSRQTSKEEFNGEEGIQAPAHGPGLPQRN